MMMMTMMVMMMMMMMMMTIMMIRSDQIRANLHARSRTKGEPQQ
jgi:hypothetical protein